MAGNVPLASVPPTGQAAPPPAAAAPVAQPKAQVPAPAQAAPAQVAPQPTEAQVLKVKFRHQDIDLPIEEARKLAQIGLSARQLDEQRAAFQLERQQHSDWLQAGQLMSQLAANDPQAFRDIQDRIAGRPMRGNQPQVQAQDDDDGLTQPTAGRSFPSEIEQRLARIEAGLNQSQQVLQQRDFKSRLDSALDKQPYLRANPEAAELARLRIEHLVRTGEVDDVDKAALVANSEMQRMFNGYLEAERQTREAKRETTAPRSAGDSTAMPRMDPEKVSYANHKSGAGRSALGEWLKRVKAGVAGPNQT